MLLSAQSLLGIALIPLIAWALSESRAYLPPAKVARIVGGTLLLQIAIAFLLLRLPWARGVLDGIGEAVFALQRATDAGTQFLFGYLAGGPAPFDIKAPENAFILAIRALPLILVLSALVQLLYHWGILQRVVGAFAILLRRFAGTGGPLGTVSAASIFLGLVEAPLMIRPYLASMQRGALFATMSVAMATIAGTVMALYAAVLQPLVPGAAGHLLAGSVMNVPAALMIARLMVPQGFDSGPVTAEIILENPPRSSMDAIAQGAAEGLKLLATVVALLLVVVALVSLANSILALIGEPLGLRLTLQRILGWIGAPIAFLLGVAWSECATAGALLGQKVVLNELIAYLEMARTAPAELSPRSGTILTYAMCSFANLGSLGILIGALTAMAPERRAEITALAPWSVLSGCLAAFLSAAVIGLVM
jgi:CNT family concentrative nucleoside transporter